MKNNITILNGCYGCGVCAVSCPKNIINISLNQEGFYAPFISNPNDCINCGICLSICAFNHKNIALNADNICIKSWAAWSNDSIVRKKCSSGGIGFEIGKQLISNNYYGIGCRYNTCLHRAEHYIAKTTEDFFHTIGSKYIQSYTVDALKQIKFKTQKYLVIGTPCQIDSIRRLIQKFHCEENFVLMDFYCHGVPSMNAWKAYIKMVEPITGPITDITWRNKENVEWHDSYNLTITGQKTTQKSTLKQGNLFLKLFLDDLCLGSQCVNDCKYKYDQSSADIRIGDLWGNQFKDNKEGVNALVTFTKKGEQIVNNIRDITLIEYPLNIVAEGQMKTNAHPKTMAPIIKWLLKHKYSLTSPLFRFSYNTQRIINYFNTKFCQIK